MVVLLSLAMWGMIGVAYVQTAHAFVHTPELAELTFSRTMLLMAASIGGSLVQLPIIGWFTQIAVTAAAMHAFYGAPIEAGDGVRGDAAGGDVSVHHPGWADVLRGWSM